MNFKEYWSDKSNNYDYPMPAAKDAWEYQQDIIDDLKAQLTNMEQCYIGIKQEHNELIAFNTGIDRKQKVAEKTAEKYKFKVSSFNDC